MNIAEAKGIVKNLVEKALKIPVLLISDTGIGKSTIIKDIGRELALGVIDLRLAQQEPGDLIGLPRHSGDSTIWLKPEWWPNKRCIIFFDELNRAPIDVRQAVFQVVTEWRMHTHVLPSDCSIISAINPASMRYQVERLDPAFTRRFLKLKIEPSTSPWVDWARENLKHQELTDFILAHPDCLCKKEEFEVTCDPTPDSYRMLDILIENTIIPQHLQIEVFSGLIGDAAATCLAKFLKNPYQRPVTAREVLKGYSKVRKRVKEQKNDATHATISDLANACKQLTETQAFQLKSVILDLPDEFKVALIKSLHPQALEDLSLYHGDEMSALVGSILETARAPVKKDVTKTDTANDRDGTKDSA